MERTKVHLVFSGLYLLLSPCYLKSSRETFFFILIIILATFVSAGACLLASRVKLAAIDFIMPIATFSRAAGKYLWYLSHSKPDPAFKCVPKSYEGVLIFGDVGLFVIECVLFRRSTLVYAVGISVFLLCQSFNAWPEHYQDLPMCPNGPLGRAGEVLSVMPFIIPVVMSVSLTKLNEMRVFLMNITMAR